jgi:hypothetical protein
MSMLKSNKNVFFSATLFIVTYFLSAYLIRIILGRTDNLDLIQRIDTNPEFWATSYGLTLKLLVNLALTFLLFKVGFLFKQVQVKSSAIIYVIIICSNIFLIQLWAECFLSKAVSNSAVHPQYGNYLFLSINQLLIASNVRVSRSLEYAFDVLNCFEFAYWLLLIKIFARQVGILVGLSARIVFVFYVFPVIFFLLIITLVNYIF